MENFKKVGQLVVGVVVFFAVMHLLQMTNAVAFAVDSGVESGKVGAGNAPAVTSFLEFGASVLSGIVFLFTRLGSASIAFVTALVGGNGNAVAASAKDEMAMKFAVHLYNKAIDGDADSVRAFVNFISGRELLGGSGASKIEEKR